MLHSQRLSDADGKKSRRQAGSSKMMGNWSYGRRQGDPTGYRRERKKCCLFCWRSRTATSTETNSLGVRQGDIVFDCGAHIGVYAKKALSAGAKLVVAVEPTPVLVECIRRNLADEIAAGRVVVSAKGVWDRSGELTLFGDRSAGAGNSFVAHGSDLEAIGQIPVTTIDTLVSELELPRVDFIKADVKGATERMILGAIETLARYRPRMALSTEEPPEDPQQLVQVLLGRRPDYQFTCGPCLTQGVKQVYTDVVFFH